MRKEYDLRTLRVKRRGAIAGLKTVERSRPEPPGSSKPEAGRKASSGYARRAHR